MSNSARRASPALWHNAKRRLKNVEHPQLSVHPSFHPGNPVSRGFPEPAVAKPSFSLWWRCPAARCYHAADVAISGHTVCLSCQLSYLRISTPECPPVLGLHASDAVLIVLLGVRALAVVRRDSMTHISKLTVCHELSCLWKIVITDQEVYGFTSCLEQHST